MVRIVLIVPSFPKLSETFIVNKFLGMWYGWDVHIVCAHSDPREWQRFPDLGRMKHVKKRVHRSWPIRPRWLAACLMPLVFLSCLWRNPKGLMSYLFKGFSLFGVDIFRRFYLDAELIALKVDLVHFEFGALAVTREYIKELLDVKLVASFRGHDLDFVGLDDFQGYYSETWKKADAFHFLGNNLWQQAVRRGCPLDKSKYIISPAIDPESFDPGERAHNQNTGTNGRPLRILSVGRLHWAKGYEYGLQAVKTLVDRGIACEYRIVGNGDSFACLAFARQQLGLDEIVTFLGGLPQAEVKAQMQWADILLHPAVEEGFGNVVIEAQAMSLPVVCSDAVGLPENVADNETGFVVPRRSPEALAEKMILLAREPEVRQQMGLAGRQRVLTHFELREQNEAIDRMYREVLHEPN